MSNLSVVSTSRPLGHPLLRVEMKCYGKGPGRFDDPLALFLWHTHQTIFWLWCSFSCNHSRARNWASCANTNLSIGKAMIILGSQRGGLDLESQWFYQDVAHGWPVSRFLFPLASPVNTQELFIFFLSHSLFSSSLYAEQKAQGMNLWVGKSLLLCLAGPSPPLSSLLLISRKQSIWNRLLNAPYPFLSDSEIWCLCGYQRGQRP